MIAKVMIFRTTELAQWVAISLNIVVYVSLKLAVHTHAPRAVLMKWSPEASNEWIPACHTKIHVI